MSGKAATHRCLFGLAALALTGGLLSACGSSSGSAPPPGQAQANVCQRVTAALTDGPDPQADPVGYALAQVLPLRQIAASADGALRGAIDDLAAADHAYYQANGVGHQVTAAVQQADRRLDKLCPGATS